MTDLDPTESQPSERPSGLDVRNASLEALESFVVENGEPPYRAKQIYRWVHQRGARSFDEMTDLPKALRIKLAEQASLPSMHIKEVERATDGTRKYAFESARGDVVEAVFIPAADASGMN
ncbi:MAG: 23S rRNA (adenine(2503)-C(2))-methyltransferase RlmN, partial [Myxococcota bacterium]